jgi:hypothetical protein
MATAHIDPRAQVPGQPSPGQPSARRPSARQRSPRPNVVARGATKAERKPRNPIAACARGVGILASTAFSVVVLGHDGLPDDLLR